MKDFNYYTKTEINENKEEKFIFIDSKIKDKNDLFMIFSKKLNFPLYFGNNWDALYDCLSDLSWITEKKTTIVHTDIPLNLIEEKNNILICY